LDYEESVSTGAQAEILIGSFLPFSTVSIMNRRADHWLPWPVFTQYLPRLAVPGAAVKGHVWTAPAPCPLFTQ
jgi:hypothetical protein